MRLVLACLTVAASAACTDFATPNQLEHTTIVAVVADPPVVAAGGQAQLSIVVADKTGLLEVPTTWKLGEAFPGVPAMGTIDADGVYTAPAVVPDRGDIPPLDSIEVTVETSEGPLSALKAMPVAPAGTANPTIAALTVGADDAMPGTVAVTKGETRTLTVTTDPPAGEDTRFAWYTPVGEIKFYQSSPCDLVVDDDAVTGPLLVVVRDGVGGVAWRAATLQVQ